MTRLARHERPVSRVPDDLGQSEVVDASDGAGGGERFLDQLLMGESQREISELRRFEVAPAVLGHGSATIMPATTIGFDDQARLWKASVDEAASSGHRRQRVFSGRLGEPRDL